MGKRSRYSDEEWDAVFAREKAGERRADLARGIRRGVTPGWVDRRRRPEGGWPDDHVFCQSGIRRRAGARCCGAMWPASRGRVLREAESLWREAARAAGKER